MAEGISGPCVATGPLIPVTWDEDARAEGRPELVGLRTLVSEAHRIVSVDLTPAPALSALLRILCAIAAAITGLDFEDDDLEVWQERREDLLTAKDGFDPEAVAAYFDLLQAQGRFRLLGGPRPFGQDPRLAEQCASSSGINKLAIGRPAGNAFSWFGHHLDVRPEPLGAQEALAGLLNWLYYGAGGLCTTRTVPGADGPVSSGTTRTGPLRGTISFHPLAPTLYLSLLAGIPAPQEIGLRDPDDLCPWERDQLPDPLDPIPKALGTRARLTARPQHAVLLVADETGEQAVDAYVTWAYHTARVDAPGDPYLIWHRAKEKVFPRYADASRGLWRDFDSLLLSPTIEGNGPRRPEALTAPPAIRDLRVLALGFEQQTGKAIDRQFVAAVTPPIYAWLEQSDGEAARMAGSVRRVAELYGARLEAATQMAWQLYESAEKRSPCPWSRTAAARYWPAAETEFWRSVNAGVEAADGLHRQFRTVARRIYDEVTRPALASTRGARARARARFELYGGLPRPRAAQTTEPTPPAPAQQEGREPVTETDKLAVERAFVAAVREACKDPGTQQALRAAAKTHSDKRRPTVSKALTAAIPENERVGAALKPYHVVAALIAQLPRQRVLTIPTDTPGDRYPRSFGRCLAQAVSRRELAEETAERQLKRLLWSTPAALYAQLPHLVRRMPERPDAIDYPQLLADLRAWPSERKAISEHWNDQFFDEITRTSAQRAEAADDAAQH